MFKQTEFAFSTEAYATSSFSSKHLLIHILITEMALPQLHLAGL